MRKILVLFVICFAGLITTAAAQSLADIAKQSRAQQKAHPNTTVIDNDVIPSVVDLSSETTPTQTPSADAKNDATDNKAPAQKDAGKSETKDDTGKQGAAEDDHKKADELKKKIADQKKEITQLEREVNVAQREAGVRAAVYYADAGTMLRDSAKFAEDSRNLKAEIDSKTHALNAAKQKLQDLQEQARKAGLSSSQIE
ncbi:MAG TPA: hypothetical protein VJA94_07645 [Candidatus Angelobacter sp.]